MSKEINMSMNLDLCPFCGKKLNQSEVDDDSYRCSSEKCLFIEPMDKQIYQGAWCWKEIDKKDAAIKELVDALSEIATGTVFKSRYVKEPLDDLDMKVIAKEALAKHAEETK